MPQEIKTTLDFKNVGKIVNLPDGVDAQDAATVHQLGGVAGAVMPAGGTTGQIIKKLSSTDYDVDWEDAPLLAWGFGGDINDQTDLISGGKILPSLLPALAITDTYVVASEAAMLALTAETGDIAVRTDETKTYILKGTDPSVLADWELLLTPTGGVVSVFGRSGAVTAQSGDYSFSLISGTAGPTQGGTGLTSYVKGDVLIATGTNAVGVVAASTTDGYVFTWDNASGLPMWKAASGGLPSMTGNNGKFLTTDGTVASWGALTGWSTTGNAGTDGGTTNFIGTTDSKKLVFKTNNRIYGFFGESGGFVLKAPYNTLNDVGLEFGYSSGTATYYINGGGVSKGDTDNSFVSGGAWASGYSLVFGTPTYKILSINTTGVTVSALTVSATSLTMPSGGKLSFLSTRIDTSGGIIAMGYDGFNSWRAAIRNGSTNILLADSNGLININPAGASIIASAALSVTSTSLGFLPPRMTTTQKNAITSPAEGLEVYDTTLHKKCVYTGSAWETITSS